MCIPDHSQVGYPHTQQIYCQYNNIVTTHIGQDRFNPLTNVIVPNLDVKMLLLTMASDNSQHHRTDTVPLFYIAGYRTDGLAFDVAIITIIF